MADSKNDKNLQTLVESIANKIEHSPVLNGGFDRMLVIVEHIQEKQQEDTLKLDNIHTVLYEPNNGLYARVKGLETVQVSHMESDEKHLIQINDNLKKINEDQTAFHESVETTNKLKKIAGDDLEKISEPINSRTKIRESINKVLWIAIAGGLGAAIKPLIDYLIHK